MDVTLNNDNQQPGDHCETGNLIIRIKNNPYINIKNAEPCKDLRIELFQVNTQ